MVCTGFPTRNLRTIFVSDVHLGCKHSRADALADFLDSQEPENLFFVGDFIDGWKLKKGWRWQPAYTRIVNRLIELVRGGTKLYYTPGNHDDFLRGFLDDFGCIDLKDEFIYTTAAGQRLLITHGDQFDRFEQSARWFTMFLSSLYDIILSVNWFAGRFQRQSRNRNYAFSAWLKLLCKRFAMFISDYEHQLVEHARKNDCDGIVCGHIHRPAITQTDEITYFNTGDWVEHCTTLVEYVDGSLELWFLAPDRASGTLEIVERVPASQSAAPELEPALAGDSHQEFNDGFSQGDLAGWIDSEPDDLPLPASTAAFAALTAPRTCPPCRPKWPSRLAGLADRGATAALRILKSPRHCWGFFVDPDSLWSWLRAEPFDSLEPRKSV